MPFGTSDYARRAQALMDKASSPGVTEEEATVLTNKAMEIMAKYKITEAVAQSARGVERKSPIFRDMIIYGPFPKGKWILLGRMLLASGCRGVHYAGYGKSSNYNVQICGFESDVDVVVTLFTDLLNQAAPTVAKLKVKQGEGAYLGYDYNTGREKYENTSSMRASFWYGYADEIGRRMRAAQAEALAEHASEQGSSSQEVELASKSTELVLKSREEIVTGAYEEAHPSLRKGAGYTVGSSGGYSAGRAAGRRANLGGRQGVGSQGRTALH